jgi:hypothetical protein
MSLSLRFPAWLNLEQECAKRQNISTWKNKTYYCETCHFHKFLFWRSPQANVLLKPHPKVNHKSETKNTSPEKHPCWSTCSQERTTKVGFDNSLREVERNLAQQHCTLGGGWRTNQGSISVRETRRLSSHMCPDRRHPTPTSLHFNVHLGLFRKG